MKKIYLKPDMGIVQLQHPALMLAYSYPTRTRTNLDEEDDIEIEENKDAYTDVWAR